MAFLALLAYSYKTDSFVYYFIIISGIDCIRDIIKSNDYYKTRVFDDEIDMFYMKKSLLSLFTLGFARIIYFSFVYSKVRDSAREYIKKRLHSKQPLEYEPFDYKLKNYYYNQRIKELLNSGDIISNEKTVRDETVVIKRNLAKLYPDKFIDIIAEKFSSECNELVKRRKEYKNRLKEINKNIAYISTKVYNKYPAIISEVMSNKPPYSVADIKEFDELKSLNLTSECNGKKEWSEYFIIQAIQPLVSEGSFIDLECNDKDVFDNHVYQLTKTKSPMVSIDGDNDPRLALDDDD